MDPAASWILRLGLALLFIAAAAHKLRDLRGFTETLRDHRILPDALAPAVSALLASVELTAAVAIVVPASATAGGLCMIALLATYSGAIGLNLARGRRHIDCGCMGPAHRQPLTGWLLVRNGLLATTAAMAAWPVSVRPLGWIDGLSIVGAVCVLVLLNQAVSGIAAHAPSLDRLRSAP
jgi:hypothetical protein